MTENVPTHELALIWAMDRNRCIGHDGGLPWHYPEDLKFFKETTLDHVIIMGRRTWESFKKPLPRRTHVVLSSSADFHAQGAQVFANLGDALDYAWFRDHKPYVIGGAKVYEAALPLATELLVTHIDKNFAGDTYFPRYDEELWQEVGSVPGETPELRFARYRPRKDF